VNTPYSTYLGDIPTTLNMHENIDNLHNFSTNKWGGVHITTKVQGIYSINYFLLILDSAKSSSTYDYEYSKCLLFIMHSLQSSSSSKVSDQIQVIQLKKHRLLERNKERVSIRDGNPRLHPSRQR